MDQRVGASLSRPRTMRCCRRIRGVRAGDRGAGLFGRVVAQSVAALARVAVRTALGATRGAVIAVALKQMTLAMIAGLAIGLSVSAALSKYLAPFIYGISTRDWLSFGLAPIAVLIVAVSHASSRRGEWRKTDPVTVLRRSESVEL